jgi:hypothetical protein
MAIDTNALAEAIAKAAEEYERQYGHLPSGARVTLSKQDTAVALELAKQELARKTSANQDLAIIAKAIQKQGQTHAQAVLQTLNENPDLYQV